MQKRRNIAFLAAGVAGALSAGCYSLEPAAGITPKPGMEFAWDINDVGRVALGGAMGPEISQVEGRLVQRDNTDYVVAVSVVRLLRGGEQTWRGEQVHIKPEYVTAIYERRFSAGRSVAATAMLAVAGAILATRTIHSAGAAEPGKLPSDTGSSQRRPRP